MAEKASKESTFTDKEIEYMAAAMISLKEGLPTVSDSTAVCRGIY